MEGLASNSETWEEISKTLVRTDSIGEFLSLKCKAHGNITKVSKGSDFNSLTKGGCGTACRIQTHVPANVKIPKQKPQVKNGKTSNNAAKKAAFWNSKIRK